MLDLSAPSSLLLAVALKGALVLALAWAVVRAFDRASAAARHGVWVAAFGALLALPVMEAAGPRWSVPLLPASPPAQALALDAASVEEPAPAPVSLATSAAVDFEAEFIAHLEAEELRLASAGAVLAAPASPSPVVPSERFPAEAAVADAGHAASPLVWVLGLWALGAGLVGLGWGVAFASARRLVARARTEEQAEWTRLAGRVRQRVGLPAPVRLLRSSQLDVPIAWGYGPGAVVLPADADRWDEDRREAVLLHEMAHLRRRDAWTQALAQAALALYWFNPLAWVAYRRFLDTREQACDDAVLGSGTRPSVYAAHLVGVARAARREPLALSAVATMARRAPLEARILSILDDARARGPLRRGGVVATAAVGAAVLLPLAAFQPTSVVLPDPPQAASSVPPAGPERPAQHDADPAPPPQGDADLFWAAIDAARAAAGSTPPLPDAQAEPVSGRAGYPAGAGADPDVTAAQRRLQRAMQQVEHVHRRVEAAHLRLGDAETTEAFDHARADLEHAQQEWEAVQDTLSAAQVALERAVAGRRERASDAELERAVLRAVGGADQPLPPPRTTAARPRPRPAASAPPRPAPAPTAAPTVDWEAIDRARRRASGG